MQDKTLLDYEDIKFEDKYNPDTNILFLFGVNGNSPYLQFCHHSYDHTGFSETVAKQVLTHRKPISYYNNQGFDGRATTLAELFPSISKAYKKVAAKIQEDKYLLKSELSFEAKNQLIETFTSKIIYDCYMELIHPDVPQFLVLSKLEIFSVIIPIEIIEIPESISYVFLKYLNDNGRHSYIVLGKDVFFSGP